VTGRGHQVILYDICLQKTLWTFERPDRYPETFSPVLFVNPKGTLIATTDLLGRVFVIDANSGKLLATLNANVETWAGYLPKGVLFSRDGKSIFALGNEDSVLEFDLETFSKVRTQKIPRFSSGKSILEMNDGNLVLVDQWTVHLIRRKDFSPLASYKFYTGVSTPTLRSGRYLQIIESKGMTRQDAPTILDLETGEVVQRFNESTWWSWLDDLAVDLSLTVNASAMGEIQILETRTGQILEEIFLTDVNEERVGLEYIKFLNESHDVLLAANYTGMIIYDYESGFQKMCRSRPLYWQPLD
jgi:outer membrane protein assembly factor BamB